MGPFSDVGCLTLFLLAVAKDEDVESGNGTSLPQSPHSVEGAIGGAKLPPIDSDFEEGSRHPIFDFRSVLSATLCYDCATTSR